jgi:hypothetical protein
VSHWGINCISCIMLHVWLNTRAWMIYDSLKLLQGTVKYLCYMKPSHVRWVPCHHGMVCPQVADGGNTLQVWRVAANILNKQSQTADKGWLSSLGIGRGAPTPHRKK